MKIYTRVGVDGFSGEAVYEEKETKDIINRVTIKSKEDKIVELRTKITLLQSDIAEMKNVKGAVK